MEVENLKDYKDKLILKDWIKSLNFRTLEEQQFKRVKKWYSYLKEKNPKLLEKEVDTISLAEWGKFGGLFDLLGEAESKTYILKYYPEHLSDIKNMKYWDLAFVILNRKIENGEYISDWESFSEIVAKKIRSGY